MAAFLNVFFAEGTRIGGCLPPLRHGVSFELRETEEEKCIIDIKDKLGLQKFYNAPQSLTRLGARGGGVGRGSSPLSGERQSFYEGYSSVVILCYGRRFSLRVVAYIAAFIAYRLIKGCCVGILAVVS